MGYVSNGDVFYGRKKNPFKGKSKGTGYGYGSLASTLLKSYINKGSQSGGYSLKGKLKTKLNLKRKAPGPLARPTRKGREFEEGGNSLTKCNFGYQKPFVPKSILMAYPQQIYDFNFAYEASSTVGLQDYTQINYIDPTVVNSLIAENDQMFITNFDAEMLVVNSSSSNSSLIFYDIICRKDCAVTNIASPGAAWAHGVDIEGGSATDYKVIGSTPTESIAFNQFYKIVQKTPITLGPGQMHRHRASFAPNKLIKGQYSANVAYGLQGLSCWTMIVHHGMPAHDSTTVTNVTIDVSDLDIVWKLSLRYKDLNKSTGAWTKTNNLATTFAVGEQFVNEAVGQVQDATGLHPGTLHA